MKILGIDAGFTNFGIAILEINNEAKTMIVTKHKYMKFEDFKDAKKRKLRVSLSDDKRIKEIFQSICQIIDEEKPNFAIIENYVLRPMFGKAWKTAMGVTACKTACYSKNIQCLSINTGDIKTTLCGKNNATKEEIQRAVEKLFSVDLSGYKGNTEHVADAIAIAYVGSVEVKDILNVTGLVVN